MPVDKFFNRRRETEFFERLLENECFDMLIAIIAPFKFGKTSLLIKLLSSIRSPKAIPILMRLNLIEKPIAYLLNELGMKFHQLEHKLREIYIDILKGKIEPVNFFYVLNKFLEKHDKWLILFLDEFQCIGEMLIKEGFLRLKEKNQAFEFLKGITEEFRLGLVVSGSIIGKLHEALKPWRGRFTIFHLTRFPREDSIKMLSTLFALSDFKIDDEKIEYIAYSVNDHPYYMQLFGYHLVNLRRCDEEAIETVRKIVEATMVSYYDSHLIELISMKSNALEVLKKIAQGATTLSLKKDELKTAMILEQTGIIYRENTKLFYYDENFKNYVLRVQWAEERFLPSYTSEYLVARHLAYKEGFREVLVAYKSWGPFDIIIPKKINKFWGIGIQVRETSKDALELTSGEINKLLAAARERNLVPFFAVLFKHINELRFYEISKNLTQTTLSQGYKELRKRLKQLRKNFM